MTTNISEQVNGEIKHVFDLETTPIEDILFMVSCRGVSRQIISNCEKDPNGKLEVTFEKI